MDAKKPDYIWVLGLIGFFADSFGIYTFIKESSKTTASTKNNIGDYLPDIVFGFILFYSWFLFSWVFTKRGIRSQLTLTRAKFISIIFQSTIGFGLLFLVISALWAWYKISTVYVLIHIIFGIIVGFAVYFLEPISSQTETMKFLGEFICKKGYYSPNGDEDFRKGDTILVYKPGNDAGQYLYNGKTGPGRLIHFSEIVYYFKKEGEGRLDMD